jgi:hypothetical protein
VNKALSKSKKLLLANVEFDLPVLAVAMSGPVA